MEQGEISPADKAYEIVCNFYSKVSGIDIDHIKKWILMPEDSYVRTAVHCALIAVDYILDETPMYKGNYNPDYQYWHCVKEEINKL